MLLICKHNCSCSKDECPNIQSEIGFIRAVSLHICQIYIPLTSSNCAVKRRWQRCWSQILFTDKSRFSLSVTSDEFWHGEKRAFKIIPCSFVKDHITDEVAWYTMGWNQLRSEYGPSYNSEWHFNGQKIYRRDTDKQRANLDNLIYRVSNK